MRNQTVDAPAMSRKARFRAALALAHKTAREWARERDVTRGHLYAVLSGERESATLINQVDAFIGEYLPDIAV